MAVTIRLRGSKLGNAVLLHDLGESFAARIVEHRSDNRIYAAEVSACIDVFKEPANSVGLKDVIDPSRIRAIETATASLPERLLIA